MKIIMAIAALWLLASSCGNHASEPEKTSKEKSFFPVAEYIKGEIKLIDSLPVGIMKKLIRGSSKDTASLSGPNFTELASEFTDTPFQNPIWNYIILNIPLWMKLQGLHLHL
jgi:hypothetical protein